MFHSQSIFIIFSHPLSFTFIQTIKNQEDTNKPSCLRQYSWASPRIPFISFKSSTNQQRAHVVQWRHIDSLKPRINNQPRNAARLLKRLRAKRIPHTHRYYLVFQTSSVPLQPIAPPSRPETSCGDAINGCLTRRYTRTTTRANVPLSFHTSMLCLQWSDEQFLRHLTHMFFSHMTRNPCGCNSWHTKKP